MLHFPFGKDAVATPTSSLEMSLIGLVVTGHFQCTVLTCGLQGTSAAGLAGSSLALFSLHGWVCMGCKPVFATPIILINKNVVVLHGGQGSLGWHCHCSSAGFYAGALVVSSLIHRKLYKICFNKVSELSKQQIRAILISLNLSTVGVCMGTEVPQSVEKTWEFA